MANLLHFTTTRLQAAIVATILTSTAMAQTVTYKTKLLDNEQRISTIIRQMTLEEKIAMLHGKNMFSSAGIPRLGIADMEYADGPFGIREEMEPHSWNSIHLTTDSATFFPTGSALAATWSTQWAYAYGKGMSREARLRGKDMILGPAINIQRIPTGGRTYEYLSEDPLLSGMLAAAYTRGAQDDGTAVCLKHYALNNQEDYRGFVDVRISDRSMHEIYLRPFEMAVREADAWALMAAYNKVGGRWCSENELLLNTILRRQWGFPGMVISDWGGVHSTVDAVTAGMNVEMPGDRYMGQALLDAVKDGRVSEDVIDQRVREILRVRLTVKPIAKEVANTRPVGNPEEMATALEVARRSIVLLKNENLLPIDTKRVKRIAVIGENAVTKMGLGGVGAGVKTRCETTPLEGLKKAVGNSIEITYAPGYKSYDRESRDKKRSPQQAADPKLMAQAVKAAKKADLVIFFAGDNREVETEGSDRKSITLPSGQDELATAIAKANKHLVTVIVAGGPVDVNTVSSTSGALLVSWFNGSMGGQALAEILTGQVSPSGKLPMTWPKRLEDVPAYATDSYPQKMDNNPQGDIFVGLVNNQSNERRQQLIANYAEESMVGYRWYDSKNMAVAYPFGYGLSYAEFRYGDISTRPTPTGFDVSFTLSNVSQRDGEEVAQVYVSRPQSAIARPVKELKAFQRVALKAGESRVVTIPLRLCDLNHWDEKAQRWTLEPGEIDILVGGSSDKLPLKTSCTIQTPTHDENFWIFLCFGQSNMAGQAPIEEQDLMVSDRYLSMATTDGGDGRILGTWRKAVPPLCRADAHLGPADWFGHTLADVVPENVRIGIVSVAVEGCPITFFDKDQCGPLIAKEERDWMNNILNQYGRNPYERLLTMAKKAAKDGVIKGILLHQGETDAYNDQWRKTLRKIYRDLQHELQFDSTAVPLLVGEVVRKEYGGICGHANPTINDIANHYPNTFVVSSEGCMPSNDNLHFSSEGYRLLGRHYALRYLEATNPLLAETCRRHLAAAGLDKGGSATSELTVNTSRAGTTLHVTASEPVNKVDVVSFSGKTVKTYAPGNKQQFDISLKGLPKEKLVFVFQSAGGKATTDIDL